MGSTELALLLKYGIPLAVKLLSGGKDEQETIDAVNSTITSIATGDTDVADKLIEADDEKRKSIIDGLFGVLTGVADAFGGLIRAFAGLFGN